MSAVLSRQTPQARQMLRKLLDGKMAVESVTVDGRCGFRLSRRLNVGRLLRAEVLRAIEAVPAADEANSLTVVAPTGFGSRTCFLLSLSKGRLWRPEREVP